MTVITSCTNDLVHFEGFKPLPYTDTTGHLTIGYGINLDDGITEFEARYLLVNRVLRATAFASNLDWYQSLDETRQRAVINLIYNLGSKGFLQFVEFIGFMTAKNYTEAGNALIASKAYTQEPKRIQWLVDTITSGVAGAYPC